jgi:hypothetical protein
MIPEMPSVSQLSQVISRAAAPAFLFGALGFYCGADFTPQQGRQSNNRLERDR